MWFAALSPATPSRGFPRLAAKLLEGDEATLRLLRRRGNPFPDQALAFVRARLFRLPPPRGPSAERTGPGGCDRGGHLLPPVRRAPEATASRP